MTKIILDEGVPRGLAAQLQALGIDAAPFPNDWKQLSDRQLLDRAEAEGFDVVMTCDKNMPFQQPLSGRRLAVLVLPTADRKVLLADAGAIADSLGALVPGSYSMLGRDAPLPVSPRKPL